MYVIITSHKDKDDTVSKPMEFKDACSLYCVMAGVEDCDFKEDTEYTDGIIALRPATFPELVYSEGGRLMIENIVATYSPKRLKIARERAIKEFGGLAPDLDELDSDLGEAFTEEYERQLKLLVAKDLLDHWEKEGLLKSASVRKDGDIELEITEQGQKILDAL